MDHDAVARRGFSDPHDAAAGAEPHGLAERFHAVRRQTLTLAAPLSAEDAAVQSMPDASPVKWHLAHTTWFFETFVLQPYTPGYTPYHPLYSYLFNSYYQHVGARWARPQRGDLSRPTVQDVYAYRAAVDDRMLQLIDTLDAPQWSEVFCLPASERSPRS